MFIIFSIFDADNSNYIEKKEFEGLAAAVNTMSGSFFPGNCKSTYLARRLTHVRLTPKL